MLPHPRLARLVRCTSGLVLLGVGLGVGPNVAWWLPRLAMPRPVDPALRANLQP